MPLALHDRGCFEGRIRPIRAQASTPAVPPVPATARERDRALGSVGRRRVWLVDRAGERWAG